MVTNFSCEQISKIKWTIEDDSINILLRSQNFTQGMIEKITAPYDEDHEVYEK
jgi:hypothetical protein